MVSAQKKLDGSGDFLLLVVCCGFVNSFVLAQLFTSMNDMSPRDARFAVRVAFAWSMCLGTFASFPLLYFFRKEIKKHFVKKEIDRMVEEEEKKSQMTEEEKKKKQYRKELREKYGIIE